MQIPDSEIDRDLPVKLRKELPGILRWIVEGAVLYHREGLGDPPDVAAATEQDRGESDRLKYFFEDHCILSETGDADSWKKAKFWVLGTEIYAVYISWPDENGIQYPLPKDTFDERLKKRGRVQDRVRPEGGWETKQIRVWLGIRLKTSEER